MNPWLNQRIATIRKQRARAKEERDLLHAIQQTRIFHVIKEYEEAYECHYGLPSTLEYKKGKYLDRQGNKWTEEQVMERVRGMQAAAYVRQQMCEGV